MSMVDAGVPDELHVALRTDVMVTLIYIFFKEYRKRSGGNERILWVARWVDDDSRAGRGRHIVTLEMQKKF